MSVYFVLVFLMRDLHLNLFFLNKTSPIFPMTSQDASTHLKVEVRPLKQVVIMCVGHLITAYLKAKEIWEVWGRRGRYQVISTLLYRIVHYGDNSIPGKVINSSPSLVPILSSIWKIACTKVANSPTSFGGPLHNYRFLPRYPT